jgi:hypothetical protein
MHKAPTIGRIVLFNDEAGRGETHPAIVTHVYDDDCVNLAVFSRDGGSYGRPRVYCGDKPGQWDWPNVPSSAPAPTAMAAIAVSPTPELQQALGELAASISSVGSSVYSLDSRVSSLTSQVSTLLDRLSAAEAQNAELKAQLALAAAPAETNSIS